MKTFLFASLFFAGFATLGMASPDFHVPDLQAFSDVATKTASDPISSLLSLSPECQSALFSVVADPEFLQCVPVAAFIPLIPVVSDPSELQKLLADPVHTLPPLLQPLFDGICGVKKCSDQLTNKTLQALEQGCQKDVDNPLIQMLTGVVIFYSPIRDSICFKDNKGEYCIIETVEKVFTLPAPPFHITGTMIDNIAFAEPESICTPCNKAIINTLFNFISADTNQCAEYLEKIGVSSDLLNIAKLGAALKCGFEFLDGKVGDPEKSDPNDFEYQVSTSGASTVKGISLVTIGALVSTLIFYI